jgi:hypothetical protein
MNRQWFCCLFVLSAFAAALAAQEPQPPDKKGPDEKGDKGKEDIISRIAKNMKSAEERLKKTDPGDATRKIQRDIIDDLDELIKQNTKQPQGGGGGGSGKKSQDQQSSKGGGGQPQQGGNKGNPGEPKMDQGAQGSDRGSAKGGDKDKDQGLGKDKGQAEPKDGEGKAKDGGDKDDKGGKGQAKGEPKDKDGNGQTGGLGTAKRDGDSKRNLAGDLTPDDRMRLPEKMRLQMDVYSRERFMPRYDDLLRQYYRGIAEQGSKKDD